ncbi:hypothetical protein BHE74_00041639, partial [Ensete ventricosum]
MHSEACDPREPQSPTGRRILDFEFRNSLPRVRTPSLSSAAPNPSPRSPALSSPPVTGSEARSAVKIVKGEFGYVLEDVPHLTDYLPDLPVIDKSFGFDTAVEEAQRAINAAHVEAGSVENGIGVVKLMGRYS